MSTARVRSGCQNCRLRHLKCDERKPNCSRCDKGGLELSLTNVISVRHELNPSVTTIEGFGHRCEYAFSKDQPWPKTDALSFIDETQDLVSIYDEENSGLDHGNETLNDHTPLLSRSYTRPPSTPGSANLHTEYESPARSDHPSPAKRRRLTHQSLTSSRLDPRDGGTSVTPTNQQDPSPSPRVQGFHVAIPYANFSLADVPRADAQRSFDDSTVEAPQIYIDNPQWPLQDLEQAKLMRYYIDNIAPFLDLCDLKRNFALVVPYRAASCPPLLNAIFAASARHLSRVAGADAWIADQYHSKCLNSLIPLLNDSAALTDENLLAAMIILRYHEEIESPHSGTGAQSHLLGTHIFMGAQERSAVSGGLRRAAFWVGLRMELFFAFLNSRSIHPSLELCNVDRSLGPADDCKWANRMVAHCAEVLRYCFGDCEHSVGRYNELVNYCSDWMTFKPPSFTPIYYKEPSENKVFPQIWVNGHIAGTGLLHYQLTKILLTAHNPKIPRLGPGQRAALHAADEEIKADVRSICGIAVSNQSTPPYFVKACMAITMAGDRFTERREQEALLGVMKRGSELAWPTMTAVRHLKDAWGWQEE